MIYLFTAKWCEPCKVVKTFIKGKEHIEQKLTVIDIDEDWDKSELYSVRGIPCVVIVDGEVVQHITGLPNILKFLKGE